MKLILPNFFRGKWLYLLSVMLMGNLLFAQQTTIVTGVVKDEKGEVLPGVGVKSKNGNKTTVTDVNGNFQIQVTASNETLIFTYIGYKPLDVTVQGKTVNVNLVSLNQDLKDVVVVGYGTQKKVNLTGAVSVVSAEDISNKTAINSSTALQGLAAGVTVTQSSGQPGAAGTIRIRGIGTLGSAGPLVLIDGVEGDIDNIDPNLIENISVLKDAASSSIYGSRAANGVILVTTKRAKAGLLTINYNGYTGWQSPTDLPKKVDGLDHMLLTNEAYVNTGKAPLYSDALIAKYKAESATNPDLYPNTDWQKEVLTGSGFMQSHFLSVNGGGEKVKFLTSAGIVDQKGIIQNSNFQRVTLRNNADITFSDKLSMKIDLQIDNERSSEPGRGTEAVFYQMNRIPSNEAFRYSNGNWGVGWNGNNPVAYSGDDGGLLRNNRPEAFLNTSLSYKPFPWLEAKITAAPKYVESISHNFIIAIPTYNYDGTVAYTQPAKSSLTESTARSFYNTFFATLAFNKKAGEHTFSALLGASREDFHTSDVSAFRDGFILPGYPVLNTGSAENQQASGGASEWALQSFFARVNYDYKSKYLLELNGRYDGSSRFAGGRKYGFFPSLSAGWRVSEEAFMKPLKNVITEFKFRGSWGRLGNQNIGSYPFTSQLSFGSYTFNKQIYDLAALNTMANTDISWESTEMTNIGMDLTLFGNLSFNADYFSRKTSDILLTLDVPIIGGLNAPFQNAGVVENKGWEIGLNYRGNAGDFKYDIGINLSDVKNKVIDLRGVALSGVTVNREGYAMNSIYGYQADGFFQSDAEVAQHATQFGNVKAGDIKYVDQNGDGRIDAADNVVIGSTIPRYTFGANLNASYKGFDLNVFLQGVGKADGYLYEETIMPFFHGGTVQEQHKDHWTPETPNATFPRLAFNEVNNEQNSSFWLKDASYLRVKNLQIGYNIPSGIAKRIGASSAKIYLSGRNLFTIDNFWDGHDVETPVGTGHDYPLVKVYTIGLNVKF
jgi:TonB-linked SusC/RagA family outer membrane protein